MSTRSSSDDSREIVVNTFDEKHAQKFREQVLRLAEGGGPDVVIPVYIDSYGGYVDSLAKMIETMDSVPNRFITICQGKAMSCGAILLSHGDVRWCGKYSRIMIHNVSSGSWGDVTSLQSNTNETTRLNQVFMSLLAKNCGIKYEDLQAKIKDTTDSKNIWLNPQQAFDFGIVDKIGTPLIHPIIQFELSTAPEKDRLTDKEKGVSRKKAKKKTRKKRR